LVDLSGVKVLDIHKGITPIGKQIYEVDTKLISGTYFVKFVIKGKTAIRKVIVK
jgi:hypothetical protein